MSRNFFPVLLAIGMGVWTGYYTFQPALRDLQPDKGDTQANKKPGQQPTNTTPEQKDSPPPGPVDVPRSSGK